MITNVLTKAFEKFPEVSLKNDLRYFMAFNRLSPKFLKEISPVRGYELHYHLKEGDIVVDAGSYPGDYAVFASRKVGKTGKVICFEPDAKNRRVLYRNLSKEKNKNFIIVPKGLWDRDASLSFNGEDGLHSVIENTGENKIEVTKLDDELAKLRIKKIDVLKMDIEGAEIQAIKGALKTLKNNNVKVMIASYHIVNGKTTSVFLENFLKKLGYQTITGFEKHLTTYAWKKI